MNRVEREVQRLEADALVSLYIIDTQPIGGNAIIRFTTMPNDGQNVLHDGEQYVPIDCQVDGFEWDGRGAFPRPRLKIANFGGLVTDALNGAGDIVGSKFYRIRTFAKYLDTGEFPDPSAIFPVEIYTVNQRVSMNKHAVEWELSSPMDHMGIKLPRRVVVRDTCTHRYRIWDETTGAFDYSNATCPYASSVYFDENGVGRTNPANDQCGKNLSDCRRRFGRNNPLPTRAFPGVAKVRT